MSKLTASNFLRRYFLLVCGLVIMSIGVALSINANMGISPISCLPYVLNRVSGSLTVGQFTAVMHVFFVVVQVLLLRRQFAPYQLLQLLVAVALGWLIDVALALFAFLQPTSYLEQWLLFLSSIVIVSVGMYLEVKAGVLMVAGEGLVKAIAMVMKQEFGKVKIATDCLLVSASLTIGLIYFHQVVGVREGTVMAAILVGAIIRFLSERRSIVDRFLAIDISEQK